MELMYPVVIIVSLLVCVSLFFINFNKKKEYTDGKKVANTKFIKETKYYKSKVKRYKMLSKTIIILNLIIIVICSILISRPVTIVTRSEDKFNRDIIISLDISISECEVNYELIKKFKEIIPDIEGDRIGIVLYNTAPIVYCPLTDDYDYINECLDFIEKQIKLVLDNNGYIPTSLDKEGTEIMTFWYGGTVANSETRGSSLIGDGLAGTVFSFPDIKKDQDRTRIIIFATDNDVYGTEAVSLEDACMLCKKYNINLYAYCPSVQMNPYTSTEKIEKYKNAVEQKAGGKFYTGDLDQMSSSIVNEIKESKTSLLKTSKKTFVTDHPEMFYIALLVMFISLIIIEKRVKL